VETTAPSAYEKLEPYCRAFVDQYFISGMNASEACRELNYKKARQQASTFLKMGTVKAAIAERLTERKLSADEVLAIISEKSKADMSYFLRLSKNETDKTVSFDLHKARKNGKLHLIRKLKIKDGKVTDIELVDSKFYLDLLAKHHKLINPEEEHGANADNNIDLDWDDDSPKSNDPAA
jgi:phage terminase small subunit